MPAPVSSSDADAPDTPPSERRRQKRVPISAEAVVACPTPHPRPRHLPPEAYYCPHDTREVTSVNVSPRGICFLSDKPLPIGTYQTIRLDDRNHGRTGEVRVLRCVERGGAYEIGAVFC